jgi:hypothetical protein
MRLQTIILFLFTGLTIFGQATNYSLQTERSIKYEDLENGFRNTPGESRLRCYWWWLNSMATKESVTRDLEEMKDKGYGGASLVDAGSSNYQVAAKTVAGPVFMSPDWMELYKHAVREADRVGIELSVNVGSGWNPGGPTITPEFALKKIVWSEINITGGKKISIELPQPVQNLMYQDILVQAIPEKSASPVQNDLIKNWKKKSFSEAIGWKGIYPLYELREDFPGDGSEVAVRKDEIVDLTSNWKNGKLEWNAPEGKWTIIRYGYTCTGARTSTNSDGWEGLSVDHLNADAFALFSKTVISPLIKAAQEAGTSVRYLQTDSWEMGVVSWTRNFPDEFRKYRGYDIEKYMPVLSGRIVESRSVSDRFLHDFRKTIGDCVADYHYRLFYSLAHENNMGIHPESGGPHSAPVDALKVMAISDFPQGEFWAMANTHRIKDDERLAVKQSACVAHTNGKRFVAAEGPTSIGPQWERSPGELKGNIDRVFCSGVNRIVWHTFTSSPKESGLPGNEYFAGTHLNPNVTWWKQSKDFISYLNRCSYLLQQGLFVADVLYYYGDDVPNFVFLKEEIPELNFGYDWDKCSKDVILDRVSYDGEKIVLPDGMSYRVMMLAPESAIDPEVLRKLELLVKQGMTLIGARPVEASGLTGFPHNDSDVNEIANRLWGKIDGKTITVNNYGKGRVIWGQNVNKVLAGMKVMPDLMFKGTHQNATLDYIHRTTNDQEIYFISNRFSRMDHNDFEFRYLTTLPDRYEQVECSFRVNGKIPEYWDPVTGGTEEILTWREENGRTVIPLHFVPEGSKFIVFRRNSPDIHITSVIKDNTTIFPGSGLPAKEFPLISIRKSGEKIIAEMTESGNYTLKWSDGRTEKFKSDSPVDSVNLSGEWNISFDTLWGGPALVKSNKLKSWTEFDDPGIKYYSGTAVYSKLFHLTNKDLHQNRLILDLGNVKEMASVKVNGHQMQVMWSAPFLFDITAFAREGTNELEVEVVNMWVNRLIADGKLPEDQRLTKTNIKKFNASDAEKYIRVSGLMGPVTIKLFHFILTLAEPS